MEDKIPEPIWIGKIDEAKRQLCEAIRMFFGERDPVAIHTLVAAAHQVFFDIARRQDVVSIVKPVDKSSPSGEAAHNKRINFAINFMKHADKDPDTKINVSPLSLLTQDLLMDAVRMLQCIDGNLPIEAKTFWTWFVSHRRDEFEGCGPAIDSMIQQDLASWDFPRISMFLKFADIIGDEPENNQMDRTPGRRT